MKMFLHSMGVGITLAVSFATQAKNVVASADAFLTVFSRMDDMKLDKLFINHHHHRQHIAASQAQDPRGWDEGDSATNVRAAQVDCGNSVPVDGGLYVPCPNIISFIGFNNDWLMGVDAADTLWIEVSNRGQKRATYAGKVENGVLTVDFPQGISPPNV